MEEGTVVLWNDQRGFGFIRYDDGEDIFTHYSLIESSDERKSLEKGQRVTFVVGMGRNNKPQAEQVRIMEARNGRANARA